MVEKLTRDTVTSPQMVRNPHKAGWQIRRVDIQNILIPSFGTVFPLMANNYNVIPSVKVLVLFRPPDEFLEVT